MGFDNRAQIECPVFKATVELRGCFKIQERYMRGEVVKTSDGRPTRQGCQSCMASAKCPTWHIVQDLRRRPESVEGLYSADPKLVKLPTSILERIAPIQTLEMHTARFEPSPREKELIDQANGMKLPERTVEVAKPRKRVIKKVDAVDDAVIVAAQSGNLAAALNAAA